MKRKQPTERCSFCECLLHRTKGTYALATTEGRSHATKHHLVPERFFGRSSNRRGTQAEGIFELCPWDQEGITKVFCYECHEELLHNPVLLEQDVQSFNGLIRQRGLMEETKTDDRRKSAARVRLFHDVLVEGLKALHAQTRLSAFNDVQG